MKSGYFLLVNKKSLPKWTAATTIYWNMKAEEEKNASLLLKIIVRRSVNCSAIAWFTL